MSHLRWFHPLMFAASLMLAGQLTAQERATMTGVVVDASTDAPIAGVRVSIGSQRVGKTDPEGRFSLCRLTPGPAELTVRLEGYRTRTAEVAVAAGEAPPLRLALAPDTSGQPVRAARLGHGIGAGPFGVMIDGKRYIGSTDGCGGTPEIPYLEMADIDTASIHAIEVVKGAEAAERFRAPVEGLIIITMKPPPAS
ncbi:MAG TPA: carboxypeptidase-like regulatory domain-containing protein [Longimicrobium sp.]|nr:carboxypeptidase-like regulatory domain-containing protein [Longimicrobium sp.]